MSQVDSDTTEVYRIRVPNPSCQLVLGKDERGYVGFHLRTDVHGSNVWGLLGAPPVADTEMELGLGELDSGFKGFAARVGSGSAFIGAGGGVFGLSRFEDLGKSFTGVNQGLAGVMAVSGFAESLMYWGEESTLRRTISIVKIGAQVVLDTLAGISNGIPKGGGAVAIYGDTSVNIGAPASFSANAIGLASVNGGVLGTVSGMVYSGLGGGILTSVSSLYSTSVSGPKASLIGDHRTTIAARHGEVHLEGKSIFVGSPSNVLPGVVRTRGANTTKQEATRSVQLDADEEIEIGVGRKPPMPMAATRMRVTDDALRLETKDAAVALGKEGRLYAGGSVVEVGASGVTIGKILAPGGNGPKTLLDVAVTAVEASYKAAVEAANVAVDTSAATDHLAIAGVIGAIVGGLTGTGAVVGTKTKDAGAITGGVLGGWVGGGYLAMLGTYGVVKLVKQKAAETARDVALTMASAARKVGHAAALRTESTAIDVALALPTTPKIEVKDTSIELSVGLNKITIDAMGIKVSAPAGMVQVDSLTTNVKGTVTTVLG